MASHVYPLAKQAFISAGINLTSDTIKIVLLDSTYTYSTAHQYYSDLSGVIGTASGALGSKTVTNGVFNAANETLSAVVTGHTIAALAGFKDTGVAGTSPLIWFDDGFSQVTNGGDINVNWDTGSNKIFSL
jgi:hypothetical protein